MEKRLKNWIFGGTLAVLGGVILLAGCVKKVVKPVVVEAPPSETAPTVDAPFDRKKSL